MRKPRPYASNSGGLAMFAAKRLTSSTVKQELFFPVFLGVSLHCLFSMPSRMNDVSPRRVSMMRCLLVKSTLVMFGGLSVVASGVRKMF
jgi:hypothetical protein